MYHISFKEKTFKITAPLTKATKRTLINCYPIELINKITKERINISSLNCKMLQLREQK